MKKQHQTHNRRKGGSRPFPIDTLSHLDYQGNRFDLAPPSKARPYYTIVGIHIGGGTQLEIPGAYRDTPIRRLSLLNVTNGDSIREVILPEQIETIQLEPSPSSPWYEALNFQADYSYSFTEIPEDARQPPLPALEAITPCEGHTYFQSYDGILFTKGLTKLVFCPWGNGLRDIKVPEETKRVSSYAFFLHPTLEAIQFQGALRSIEPNAFSICLSLESVDLSACSQLSMIERHAFNRCKIQRIAFPDAPFSLGTEAFADALFGDVLLPPTVKKLGVHSLTNVRKVTVVEGSAKGLFRALESAEIHILHRDGGGEALFFPIYFCDNFPTIKELSKAWNESEPLLPILDDFIGRFGGIAWRPLAQTLFLQFPDHPDIPHIRRHMRLFSYSCARTYLKYGHIEEFLTFLRTGIIPPQTVPFLLRLTNNLGLVDCTAHILEYYKDTDVIKEDRFEL